MPDKAYSIVVMTAADVPQVYEISQKSNLSYWSVEDYRAELKIEDAICLVAKDQTDIICGFAVMRLIRQTNNSNYLEINNIAVEEKYRNKGIGSNILLEIDKICRNNNLAKIFLEVRESNTNAISLYLKNGFRKSGRRKRFYSKPTEDALTMIKDLTEI